MVGPQHSPMAIVTLPCRLDLQSKRNATKRKPPSPPDGFRFKPKKRNIHTKTHAFTNPITQRIRLRFTLNRQPRRSNSGTFKEP